MAGSDEDDGATLPPPEMGQPRCGTRTHTSDPRLSPDAQDRIGRDLRRMCEALLLEPQPESILDAGRPSGQHDPREHPVTPSPAVREAMLAALPNLRAFALSLCHNTDRADDLVQDTILRAWANLDKFEPGTNLQAWLFTILRNGFYSTYRKRQREVAGFTHDLGSSC